MIEYILGVISGFGIAYWLGKNENIRDWYQYGKGRKYR